MLSVLFYCRKRLIKEDDELDIAVDVVSEVTELVWTIVRDHLIEEQCFSYACDFATEKMLQIVEWHYLSRDEEECSTAQDSSWNEDTGVCACLPVCVCVSVCVCTYAWSQMGVFH